MCPAEGEGRCVASRYDGAVTPPRTPGPCRSVEGQGTAGWCTGSPTGYGSLDWGFPSSGAAHTANPVMTDTGSPDVSLVKNEMSKNLKKNMFEHESSF